MSETIRSTVTGFLPAPHNRRRLVERRARERVLRQERRRKPDKPDDFVCYENSDSDDDTPFQQAQTLRTSYSFVDYVCSRQSNCREPRSVVADYAGRHILTHDMYKERPVVLGNCNKVFCSKWLSNRQVVFGTKCNKLMVYDVNMRRLEVIPTLSAGNAQQPESQNGIHAIQLNPSRSLLATGARHSADIAVYRLPTLDPVCLGSGGHRDWLMDLDWLDDQFLVSGSKDAKMALWRISDDVFDAQEEAEDAWAAERRAVRGGERQQATATATASGSAATSSATVATAATAAAAEEKKTPQFVNIQPLAVKECKAAQKIRSLCFNATYKEIVIISLNGYIHLFNAETFSQVLSRKLPNCQDNVCIAHQPNGGLYAVGCRSYTLLLDPRTLQVVKKIASRYSGCGIRSASFQEQLLTVGTGLGMLMFYDVRAGKYLESATNASRTVVLKASKGYVFPEEEMEGFQQIKYVPAIYTHCYDTSGTRIFAAGGPLPATLVGNYAGIWQ